MKNIKTIQNDTFNLVSQSDITNNPEVSKKIKYDIVPVNFGSIIGRDTVEFHLFDLNDELINSNHKIPENEWSINYKNNKIKGVNLNVRKNVLDLTGDVNGKYKFIYNFHRNIIGSYFERSYIYVTDLDTSNYEVKLFLNKRYLEKDIEDFKENFNLEENGLYDDIILNFGKNKYYKILNYRINEYNDIILKLNRPINEISINDSCWIDLQVRSPFRDKVIINLFKDLSSYEVLQPNFNVEIDEFNKVESEYKTWNDLLSSNIHTSNEILYNYLGSLNLNIDYSSFENFVNFSSAEERIRNFKYKLKLIENYNSKISTITNTSGSIGVIQDNLINILNNRNKLIRGFDGFESYLYFENTGSYFTHIPRYIDTWPKTNETENWKENLKKWVDENSLEENGTVYDAAYSSSIEPNLYSVTSSIASNYYDDLLEKAIEYDRENVNNLYYTIPRHIREDENNKSYELFVNMMGHHFDIIWTYINKLNSIFEREEHPSYGIPDHLIKRVGESLGWTFLENDSDNENLWNYIINQNEDTNNLKSQPHKKISKEIWRRILNNLNVLLKSKGTERSIRALLSCYGVPETILKIKEFGKKININKPDYEINKFNYETYFSQSYITIPSIFNGYSWNSLEFRFKPTEIPDSTERNIFKLNNNIHLTYQYIGDSKIDMNFYSGSVTASISDIKTFDNEYLHVLVNNDSPYNNFYVKKAKYGKIVLQKSASVSNTNWNIPDTDINFGEEFVGYSQELRFWKHSLQESFFDDHVIAPIAFNMDNASGSYYNLLARFKMSENINYDLTSSLESKHPANNDYTVTASLNNFSSDDLSPFEETNYINLPKIGGGYPHDNKIDIVENELINNKVEIDRNLEKKSYDADKQLSNKMVGVYFSPTNIINQDIFAQMGGLNLDNYTGKVSEYYGDSYKSLKNLSEEYYQKYGSFINVNDYIRFIRIYNFSIFEQIKNLLPKRTNKLLGLVIEPNILERNKFRKTKISKDNLGYKAIIRKKDIFDFSGIYRTTFGNAFNLYTFDFNGDHNPVYQTTKIVTKKYNPSVYSYDYLLKWKTHQTGSEKVFIEVSTPDYISSPTGSQIIKSRKSNFIQEEEHFYNSSYSASLDLYYSSSLKYSDVTDYTSLPTGIFSIRYGGSRMKGNKNENSPDTVDGGPVVEVKESEGNQLYVKEFDATSGSINIR